MSSSSFISLFSLKIYLMKKLILLSLILCQLSPVYADVANTAPQREFTLNQIRWAKIPRPIFLAGDLEGKPRQVSAVIDADTTGQITNIKISQSSGLKDLDKIVIKAIQRARFKPYQENGVILPFRVTQSFKFEADDYSLTRKSTRRNNSSAQKSCSYQFNSDVIKLQQKNQETPFSYIQTPPLSIRDSDLNGANRNVVFQFKLSRKNIISNIELVKSSGIDLIDQQVINAVSIARVEAPRKFYQFFKITYQDQIEFKLSECL